MKGAANTVLFGIVTSLALLLFYWFFTFISDQSGSIAWAMLIIGAVASASVVLYITVRWYTSAVISSALATQAEALRKKFSAFGTGDQPITQSDFRAVLDDAAGLVPQAWRIAQVFFTITILLGVTVEIAALANAAVSYLQAQRLSQQNELLSAQKQVEEAAFLNETMTSLSIVARERETLLGETVELKESFASQLSVAGDLVNSVFEDKPEAERVAVDGFLIDVCGIEGPDCGGLGVERLARLVAGGELSITPDMEKPIRAYHRLSEALEIMLIAFLSDGANGSLNDAISKKTQALKRAVSTCQVPSDMSTALLGIWDGFSGAGLAATDMWPVESINELKAPETLPFTEVRDKANFLGLAAGVQLIKQSLGLGTDEVADAAEAAQLIDTALRKLAGDQESILTLCDKRIDVVNRTVDALQTRQQLVLERIEAETKQQAPQSLQSSSVVPPPSSQPVGD